MSRLQVFFYIPASSPGHPPSHFVPFDPVLGHFDPLNTLATYSVSVHVKIIFRAKFKFGVSLKVVGNEPVSVCVCVCVTFV